jgi:hypothetical protein
MKSALKAFCRGEDLRLLLLYILIVLGIFLVSQLQEYKICNVRAFF